MSSFTNLIFRLGEDWRHFNFNNYRRISPTHRVDSLFQVQASTRREFILVPSQNVVPANCNIPSRATASHPPSAANLEFRFVTNPFRSRNTWRERIDGQNAHAR